MQYFAPKSIYLIKGIYLRKTIMKRYLLLLLTVCALTACDKDEKGQLLSKNQLTAIINETMYIDRQPFNLWLRTTPHSTYTPYSPTADVAHLLIIRSVLTPTQGDGEECLLVLYIPNFTIRDSWVGFETSFEQLPPESDLEELATLGHHLKASRKGVAVIKIGSSKHCSAQGTLRITKQNGLWYHADLTLENEEFSMQGKLYSSIESIASATSGL